MRNSCKTAIEAWSSNRNLQKLWNAISYLYHDIWQVVNVGKGVSYSETCL